MIGRTIGGRSRTWGAWWWLLTLTSADMTARVTAEHGCQLAVAYTRHVLQDQNTRSGMIVVPQPSDVTANLSARSTCGQARGLLRSVWDSVVKVTWMQVDQCLSQTPLCRRLMRREAVVVIFWDGSASIERLYAEVLGGVGGLSGKWSVILVVFPGMLARLLQVTSTRLDPHIGTNVWASELRGPTVHVSELYRKCFSCDLILHEVMVWSERSHRTIDERTKYDRRGDLEGITLNAVGVKVFPIYTAVESVNDTEEAVGGVFFLLASALASDLNFRLNITLLDGYSYGKRRAGGSYTGMVGYLQRGEADLTVSEVSFTMERERVIDYTGTVSVISRRVYVSASSPLDAWLTQYQRGISGVMMALLALLVLLLAAVLRRCEAAWPRRRQAGGDLGCPGDALLVTVGVMLQQGSAVSPQSLSARITMLTALLCGLVIYTAYAATLVSFLAAAGQLQLPFADMQALLRMPEWRVGWKAGDLLENVLDWCALNGAPTADCTTLGAVWKHHVLPDKDDNLVRTYEEGFRKVAAGQYAFMAPNEAADYQLARMDPAVACRVQRLHVKYSPGSIAIGLQQNSPYKELFDQSLRRLHEVGVTEKLYRSVLSSRPVGCGGQQPLVEAGLLHTLAAFLVLAAGGATAGLLLAAEIVVWRLAHGRTGE